MFVSVAPGSLPAAQEDALRRMLSVNACPREAAQPLDWQDTTLPRVWLIGGEPVTFSWYGPRGVRVSFDDNPSTEDE